MENEPNLNSLKHYGQHLKDEVDTLISCYKELKEENSQLKIENENLRQQIEGLKDYQIDQER